MFDYSILHWTTFFTAAVLLNLSPGPDMAYVLGHSIKSGRSAGFAAMFGVWSGALVHVLMAALGLSAIVATSAVAFGLVKWIGVFYLLYLGIQSLRSKGSSFFNKVSVTTKPAPAAAVFKQGILISILNPKVAIFFLAFLPQFVVPGAGPVWLQLSLHGLLIILVAGLIEPPLIILGSRVANSLNNVTIGKWLDRGLGALFVGLGLRLAISER